MTKKRSFSSLLVPVSTWFKNLFKRFRSNTSTVSPGTHPDKDNLDNDEFFEEYSKKVAGFDDINVKLGLHQRISASLKYVYEMGRRDGSLGVKLKRITDIARSTAQEMYTHISVMLKGKLAALRIEMAATKKIEDHDYDLYKHEQSYHDYVRYQYRFFPRSHSYLLFFIYLIIGIALIVADMPLALKLISKGFNIEKPLNDETIPENSDLVHLFTGDFWSILAYNWETLFTAIGIALCTVYIKIYYDEFVGTPFGNRLMTFKRFLKENSNSQFVEGDENIVLDEHKRKMRWKTGLAIFTFLTLLFLALFRLETMYGFKMNFFSGAAFIFITLLFPIIGGVCFSYSLNNFQNLVRLKKAKKQFEASRRRWGISQDRNTELEKKYNDLQAANERFSKEDSTIEEFQNYILTFYERGYAIGSMQPDKYMKGEDFFTKILEWRNFATSRKINDHLNNINPN